MRASLFGKRRNYSDWGTDVFSRFTSVKDGRTDRIIAGANRTICHSVGQ